MATEFMTDNRKSKMNEQSESKEVSRRACTKSDTKKFHSFHTRYIQTFDETKNLKNVIIVLVSEECLGQEEKE